MLTRSLQAPCLPLEATKAHRYPTGPGQICRSQTQHRRTFAATSSVDVGEPPVTITFPSTRPSLQPGGLLRANGQRLNALADIVVAMQELEVRLAEDLQIAALLELLLDALAHLRQGGDQLDRPRIA